MRNEIKPQYDILVATVDPSDWSIKKVGIYSDVRDAIKRHPSEDGLGSWLEGGIDDLNFKLLPEYHAIELVHSSIDPMMYLAMKGRHADKLEKALKAAVEFRKNNPKKHPEELAQDTSRFVIHVVEDYMARSGNQDRDAIYGAMSFLLYKLSTGTIPAEGVGFIPPFFLVPDITTTDNAISLENGQRPYSQSPGGVEIGQYDILSGLVALLSNFHNGGELALEFNESFRNYWEEIEKTRQWLRNGWEESLREMMQEPQFNNGLFTEEEIKSLPLKEVLIRLLRHSYRAGADTNLIEWAVKIDLCEDLQIFTEELYREAAEFESADPVGGFAKGTDVKKIADAYPRKYLL